MIQVSLEPNTTAPGMSIYLALQTIFVLKKHLEEWRRPMEWESNIF